ncbi:MAG: aspartate-semialdehyde dehydrogenase [Candidatus Margulisbacteria bacterium]|nr:aspartate-semialdehyde dehydrogenase [Candidatus Margulisiibacteriota bacterium]
MKKFNVAVVGATGMVGQEMLKVLHEEKFPIEKLVPLASERSSGKKVKFGEKELKVEVLDENSFEGIEIALFSAGAKISEKFAPIAAKAGAIVIDNTSFFRMDPDVPLVVPEVNPGDIKKVKKGIIANPNCSTAQLVLALKPIHDAARIKRVVVDTYQAVSGAGKELVEELRQQTEDVLKDKKTVKKVAPYQIAFNLIPQIDVFLDNGYTKEEMKMTNETKKIMGDDSIELTATCVRVPVFIGHSEAVTIETEKKLTAEQVKELLRKAPGVEVVDDPSKKLYPMPLDCAGRNETFVGRIREDVSCPNGISLFVVSDNLRKGAAWNAVQIAQEWIKNC